MENFEDCWMQTRTAWMIGWKDRAREHAAAVGWLGTGNTGYRIGVANRLEKLALRPKIDRTSVE
jgi:hypothetical protein